MLNIPERIVNSLATTGWYAGESIFTAELSGRLMRRARLLADTHELHSARVGHNAGVQAKLALRSDDTRWLAHAPDDASEQGETQDASIKKEKRAFGKQYSGRSDQFVSQMVL